MARLTMWGAAAAAVVWLGAGVHQPAAAHTFGGERHSNPQTCAALYQDKSARDLAIAAARGRTGAQSDNAYQYGPLKVHFMGDRILTDQKLTRAEVRAGLNKVLGPPKAGETDKSRIHKVLKNIRSYPRYLKGTGALIWFIYIDAVHDFMFAPGSTTLRNAIFIDPNGRIDKGSNGFQVRRDYSGHITVTMCFEVRLRADGPVVGHYRYRVRTDVMPCGFRIVRRNRNTKNAFPGSHIFLTQHQARNFRLKLQALGRKRGTDVAGLNCPETGNYMKIAKIEIDRGRGRFHFTLSPSNPNFAPLFRVNAESCIDMMLFRNPITHPIDPAQDKPLYCLGRCTSPAIINSGV